MEKYQRLPTVGVTRDDGCRLRVNPSVRATSVAPVALPKISPECPISYQPVLANLKFAGGCLYWISLEIQSTRTFIWNPTVNGSFSDGIGGIKMKFAPIRLKFAISTGARTGPTDRLCPIPQRP